MLSSAEPLSAGDAIALVTEAGLPITDCRLVNDPSAAVREAETLGFPVVLKAAGLNHKSDVGGVALGLISAEEVRRNAFSMIAAIGQSALPLLVQPQLEGIEILVGARREPRLGAVIAVGAGGIAAELSRDVAQALIPLDLVRARALLQELDLYPLLTGYRGRPARDIEALCEVLVTTSHLMQRHPEISELDFNPVIVGEVGQGAVIVDVRVARSSLDESPTPITTNLDRMLNPRHVVLVGVSDDPSKIGAKLFRYFVTHGFDGRIDLVHPGGGQIEGYHRHRRLADVGGSPDLVCVLVPAAAVEEVARDAVALQVGGILIHSSGFAETGSEGKARQDALADIFARANIAFGGPNTMGIITPMSGVTSSISGMLESRNLVSGGVGFITSSGALGSSIGSRFMEQSIGMSRWIHLGNEAGIEAADYLAWLAADPQTTVVGMLLESISNGDRLVEAGRTLRRAGKVAFAYSTSRSASGQLAAISHTGSIVGSHALREAVLKRAGIISVSSLQVLEDVLCWAATSGFPGGPRLAAITASGGACTIIADEAEANGIDLPPLPSATAETIRAVVPDFAAVRNPLDVTAQIISDQSAFIAALKALIECDAFDCILVQFTTHADPGAIKTAQAIVEMRQHSRIPIYVSRYGAPGLAPQGMAIYAEAGIPVLDAPDRAMRAIGALVRASRAFDPTDG